MLDAMTANSSKVSLGNFFKVRHFSEELCASLEIEDYCLQSMPEVSPLKWHLAHTSWFFETFILIPFVKSYRPFHKHFDYLFNSYYQSVGKQYPRPQRGLQSRPTVTEVYQYRSYVNEHMDKLFQKVEDLSEEIIERMILGCHHEQQHQELMLTDLLHCLSFNPIAPVYREKTWTHSDQPDFNWVKISGDEFMAGVNSQNDDFFFDNETPQFSVKIRDFRVSNRLITNAEFIEFIQDGGYQQPLLWLSDGWDFVQQQQIDKPLYWKGNLNSGFEEFSLNGLNVLDLDQPVSHISFYETEAFARWHGSRLLNEFEWEYIASKNLPVSGNFVDSGYFHPLGCRQSSDISQLFGDCWEWTQSGYFAYPGYLPAKGAIGEYNGKFMCNQFVLRGGSCVSSRDHLRSSYRNFFYPDARWQFSGIRIARDQ